MPNPFFHPFVVKSFAKSHRVDAASLRHFQNQQLRRLVQHAWNHVPFYRDLYDDAGVDIAAFRGLADLEKLPVVTRQQLQKTPPEHLVSRGVPLDTMVTRKTSGSIGAPIAIRRTRLEEAFLQSSRLPARSALGIRPWDRRARIALVHRVQTGGVKQISSESQRAWLFPFRSFDGLSEPSALAQGLADYQARNITGNPGFLERMCMEADPALLKRIRPRVVICGGETLQPGVRRLIESTLDAPVYDFYGAHEFNFIAWQREHNGPFEISGLVTLAEVLRPTSAEDPLSRTDVDEPGEFVGTALWSFASPFIRYRLGDDVTAHELDDIYGTCRSLHSIHGRVTDRFVTIDGLTMHAYEAVTALLTHMPWTLCYQIEQYRAGELLIRVVPSAESHPVQRDESHSRLREALAPQVTVTVEFVEQLRRGTEAKRKLFIRHVPLPQAPASPSWETPSGHHS